MRADQLALALGSALALAACGGGGGGDGGGCPGTGSALVGACLYAGGTCVEYRGTVAPDDALADCEAPPAGAFEPAACPEDARSGGACSWSALNGTVVLYDPTVTADELRQACVQQGRCFDTRSGGEGCAGASDELVGSCAYADGYCTEYRGGLADVDARADCASGEAGTYRSSACPASARTPGSCVVAVTGGTVVYYAPGLSSAEFQQACAEVGGCYQP
jgi:hypothetical protein